MRPLGYGGTGLRRSTYRQANSVTIARSCRSMPQRRRQAMQGVGSATASAATAQRSSTVRWHAFAAAALPFVVVGGLWEIAAHLQIFPARLFPSLESIASTFVRLTVSGLLPRHAADT